MNGINERYCDEPDGILNESIWCELSNQIILKWLWIYWEIKKWKKMLKLLGDLNWKVVSDEVIGNLFLNKFIILLIIISSIV